MTSKTFNSRIIVKHDTAVNWDNTINFIPLLGEIIIYDPDETYKYSRLKIGDGVTSVVDLPFELDPIISNMVGEKTTGNVYTIDNADVTAAEGAEVFNDYVNNIATGNYSHAEGRYTTALGENSHAEGDHTTASGENSHAEGVSSKATGKYSHAEGWFSDAIGSGSHAEGSSEATGMYSHAEGNATNASGDYSHAEGLFSTAEGEKSHAEGDNTTASGESSHAEGDHTQASGDYSHAEGYSAISSGEGSHAEGEYTEASSDYSHAEGYCTFARGTGAHAEGCMTLAIGEYQHVQGKYNVESSEYAHIVGNGVSEDNYSNAHTLDWDGNAWFAGDVYVGSTSGTNKDEGSKKLATEEFVNAKNEELNEQINTALTDKANQIEDLYNRLNSNATLSFYCVEDVTIIVNGVSTTYPANSNVEIKFLNTDVFEIVPTSDNSILALNAFPGALGTYYPWLEGVKQFSNILFDMNNVDFYSKWSQGNQGAYQVQFAQYINCIFWSDNPYIAEVTKRTNYTLYYSAQLPLCYSSIPDNTFKAFFLAFGVNSDPNWGNPAYRESFAKATWATQAFSYYGARTVGIFGHDDPDFNITLPKDCRGLMYDSAGIENAGTFDAINVTNFGAKSGSWRDAFGRCYNLKNLYIKNLKVNLNLSWSPISYEAISFIISKATNTNAITISLSPYTYYLLKDADFELAASKNITIELLTTNSVEDRRLSTIANKADKTDVDTLQASIPTNLINGATVGSLRGINTSEEDDSYTIGENAFAIGNGTKASGKNSFASGKYNIADDTSTYATIIGNGDADSNRKNIHTLEWSGNVWFAGDVYVGSTSGINKDEGSKKLATEEYVNTIISNIEIPVAITADEIDVICGNDHL